MYFQIDEMIGNCFFTLSCPKTEMFRDLPYYLLVSNKADDFHFSTTIRTAQRVCLIDLFDTIAPLF